MHLELTKHWDRILDTYSEGVHRDTLIEAKEKFFDITGKINEDDPDYESRMHCFNDWYICQFISDRGTTTVLSDYLIKNSLDEDLVKAFESIHYSLFHFSKRNFRKHMVLKDLLYKKKFIIDKDFENAGVIEDDLLKKWKSQRKRETSLCKSRPLKRNGVITVILTLKRSLYSNKILPTVFPFFRLLLMSR
jgi:hypothetical protein